jgi:hypothetical protein
MSLPAMTTRSWDIPLEGQPHTVVLRYRFRTRQVLVDGVVAASRTSFNPIGSLMFAIYGHPAEVLIGTSGFVYRYLLFVDGEAYIAREDNPVSGWIGPMVDARNFWPDLARLTGLTFVPDPKATGVGWHRLAGVLQGYPVLLRPMASQSAYLRQLDMTIRFAPVPDLGRLKSQIRRDTRLKVLLRDPLGETSELTGNLYRIRLSRGLEPEPAIVAARRVREVVTLLERYVSPPPLDACEWPTGAHDTSQPPKQALVNDVPYFLCPACLDNLPQRTDAVVQAFRQTPPGRLKALLAGCGATVVAAFVLAVLFISVDRISYFIFLAGMNIFGLNVRLLDYIRGKRLLSSMLFSIVLAAAGVWLCLYLASLWYVLRYSGHPGDTLAILQLAARTMWPTAPTQARVFQVTMILAGLSGGAIVFSRWLEQFRQLRRMLRPRVEVIGDM